MLVIKLYGRMSGLDILTKLWSSAFVNAVKFAAVSCTRVILSTWTFDQPAVCTIVDGVMTTVQSKIIVK